MNKERKHIRLRNYDYSSDGLYFITICTKDRENFFGEIQNEQMILNEPGKIAEEYLNEIPNHFSQVEMDEFIVMPNHVHCILILDKPHVGTQHVVSPSDNDAPVGTSHVMSLQPQPQYNQFSKPIPGSVSVIIQQFKSSVKRWCNKNGHEYFQWQSRFHDHIIRDAESYERIKNYIINNPTNWNADSLKNQCTDTACRVPTK